MSGMLRFCVRWAPCLLWPAAVAGIWLLPVRAVVVLTGAAVTDTAVAAERRGGVMPQDVMILGRALAVAVPPAPVVAESAGPRPARHTG